MAADTDERRDLLLHHLFRRRRPPACSAGDHDGDHPHARLRRDRRRRSDPHAPGKTRVRAVAGGTAARVRVAERAVGGVVGATRRQLAERRADVRLQRRLRRHRRPRPRRPRTLARRDRGSDAGGGRRLWLRAAHEGVPLVARRARHLRAPAGPVRLLERDRADRRDGRDRLHLAGSPAARTRAVERARLPRDRPAARHADARLLARCAGRAGGGPGAVVRRRAAAPARRRRAAPRRRRRRAGGRLGLLAERPQQRQRRAPRTRGGRTPARRAAARDVAGARDRGDGDRLLHRPACAFTRGPQQRRGGSAEHPRARRRRLRGRARRQPPRAHRQHLPRLQYAHQHPRAGPRRDARPPDRDRQRARASTGTRR